jgi:hypothetical protein
MGVRPIGFFHAKNIAKKQNEAWAKPWSPKRSRALNSVSFGRDYSRRDGLLQGILPFQPKARVLTRWFQLVKLEATPIQDSSGGDFEA